MTINASSGVEFGDLDAQLALSPPVGVSWKFLSGFWALVPDSVQVSLDGDCRHNGRVPDVRGENPPEDSDLPENEIKSDDLVIEFKRNLRVLMLGLQKGNPEALKEQKLGIRQNELQKILSSK